MNPLISVVVPIYNVEKYLRKCIDSILSQSYANLEIILVDDGSPDNSGEICDEYANRDHRIKVIHKENGGLSSARNAGLDVCTGEYISFIDSDDFVSPYFIQALYSAAEKYDADVTTYNWYFSFSDENEVHLDTLETTRSEIKTVRESLELMFYQCIPSGAQHRLYKRYIFDTLRYPVGDLFEEMATVYKTYLLSRKTAVVYGNHYAYRINPNGIVRMKFSDKKLICVPVSQKTYADIIDYDESLKDAVSSRMFAFIYQIFLQVPSDDKSNQKLLWNELKKYNKSVIRNRNRMVRKKNKIAAVLMCSGRSITHRIGNFIIYHR